MNRIGSFMKTAYTQTNPFFATNTGRRQSAGTQSNGVGQSTSMYSGGNDLRQKVRALSGNGTDNGSTQSTGSFAQSVLSSSQSYGDSLRMQRTNAKQTRTALKQLRYRFKDISSKILRSKTSAAARQVASQARREVLRLKRERLNGNYDDEEIEAAIVHAKAMERVAKKKVKHLEEEEMAKASGGPCAGSMIDDEEETDETTSDEELQDAQRYDDQQALADEEGCYDDADLYAVSQDYINAQETYSQADISGMDFIEQMPASDFSDLLSNMQELTSDMFDETEEGMRQMLEEMGFDELSDSLSAAKGDMDPADLKEMKIKHRNKEMKDIVKADADYLKTVFNRLQREKEGSDPARLGGASSVQSQGTVSFLGDSVPAAAPAATAADVPVPVAVPEIDVSL